MKFGIMNLFPADDGGGSGHRVLRETLEEIQLADELGFDSVWLAEHHFSEYGILGHPLQFGMAIAERTKNITIGTAVLVLSISRPASAGRGDRHPGRAERGPSRCWRRARFYQPREFAGFGSRSKNPGPATTRHSRS